jgi:4-amino-4-deoxy-L-arabinose transferase-like glycosyltransferase
VHSPESLDAGGSGDPQAARETERDDASVASRAAQTDPWSAKQRLLWVGLAFAFASSLLLFRLSKYGIWDPWELRAADEARKLLDGGSGAGTRFALGTWLISLGFRLFGVHEWSGRLPIALSGLVCLVATYQLTRRFAGARAAVYATLVASTCPLFLFNARTMLGAAPDMALTGLLGLCAISAVAPVEQQDADTPAQRRASLLWLLGTLALCAATILTRGALQAAVPPLGAAVAAAFLTAPSQRTPVRRASAVFLGLLLTLGIFLIARDVQRDAAEHSVWLGGGSSGASPTTFEYVIEQVFHAFAPWSALLPLALSRLAGPAHTQASAPPRWAFAQACLIWAALAYAAETLFLSRYGHDVTFYALVPLAALVGIGLRELEAERGSLAGAGLGALLLVGLWLRDFALFPNGPLHAVPIGNFEVPKVWNPRASLAAFSLPFAACALFSLAIGTEQPVRLDVRAPYRFLVAQWRRGWAFRAWLVLAALLLVALCVSGALAYIIPRHLHLPSLALKILRRLLFTPLALAGVVLALQLVWFGFSRLKGMRMLPLLLAGAVWGGYLAQGYLPRLSEHYSPREVYSAYNELAAANEPLAEYHVGGRAAPYYAKGPVKELMNIAQLVDHLAVEGQRWAAFPNAELADIDHAFRVRTGRHLVVVDTRSAHAMLVAALPLAHRKDENFLAEAVTKNVPARMSNPISVNFDDRIELLGFDLDLPQQSHVGAGESFTLTWYFRSTRKVTSPYRLFVHVDGEGQRIHGDHDPVEGKYPVPLWEPSDVIADRQKIDVPASSHAGEYTIYMGFYSGDTRLPIKQGPNAGEDRARVGVLQIR